MPRLSSPVSASAPNSRRIPSNAGPLVAAFLGSVLLSVLAFSSATIVSRDAALYLEVARQVVELGPTSAFRAFNWPWFSLLLAATSSVVGLPLEAAAYFWCTLFAAGTSVLLVLVTRRFAPGSAWWACLVVLSVPAFNQFRGDIIREHGSWFFSLVALLLALRWWERGGWWRAAAIQSSIALAALFRLEAVILAPALALCMLGDLQTRQGWKRLLQLNALPLASIAAMGLAWLSGAYLSQPRIVDFLAMVDPRVIWLQFESMADQVAAVLVNHGKADARQILFFGLSLTLLVKFLALSGPLCLPLLDRTNWQAVGEFWRKLRPFAWTWILYLCVLLVFFVQQRFINSRYISFLNLLVVPLLTMALMMFCRKHARWARFVVLLLLLVMVDNVVSLKPGKTHYREAAAWVAANTRADDLVYYEDPRIAYYAGRGYPVTGVTGEQVVTGQDAQGYRYYVFTHKPDNQSLGLWLASRQQHVIRRFENRGGDTILVIGQ